MAITPGKLQTQSSAHALVIRPDTTPAKYLSRLLIYAVIALDDIDVMPKEIQALFLDFLNTGNYSRVGEPGTILKSNVRVIAASHINIPLLVGREEFRDDLWNRLRGKIFDVPPLRDRKEDIPFWAERLLESLLNNKRECMLTPTAMELLMQQSWPDNLYGLRNALQRSLALKPEGDIDAGDLALD